MKWKNPNFCSMFGDQVRVELGPQIVELPATEQYLDDSMSMPYYKEGFPDAHGKIIEVDPNGGENTMHVVDWRQKHVCKLWKVYQSQELDQLDPFGRKVIRYVKLKEFESKDDALKYAKTLKPLWKRLLGAK